MNDFIDVKLAFSEYIHNVTGIVYRYINNGALKKVLIFPLFLLLFLLELSLFPIALVGAIVKWMITFLVWTTEDKSQSLLYVLIALFVEFFILYYVLFATLILFYKLFNLMSNGLGKADYETNADEYVAQHDFSKNVEKNSMKTYDKPTSDENNPSEVYVINTDEYK